jgi:putative nucleotidyltransferase with HDIG domain
MLYKRLNVVETIPTLPEILTRVMAMVDDPDASAYDLANVISRDPSLVATILKVVNSPFYGLSRQVSSIGQAVILLGFRTIRNLVLSASLLKSFGGRSLNRSFDRRCLWKHAIATGAAAKRLAPRAEMDLEEAFLAGLLHDIGCVILDQYFPEEFAQVLGLLEAGERVVVDAEMQATGMTHAEVGQLVCQKWNFPQNLCRAIGHHHEPSATEEGRLEASVVHVADLVASRIGLDAGFPGAEGNTDPVALQTLGFEDDLEASLLEEALAEYEKANIFVGLVA